MLALSAAKVLAVQTPEALAELEKELQIDTKYPLDTVKPCLLGILDHDRKDYIVEMLKSRESTIYKYDITEAGEIGRASCRERV